MLNSALLIILIMFLSVLSLAIAPLVASLVLCLFSRLFKFQKNDFRTALYCNLIIFGIFVGISSVSGILFLGQKLSPIFTIFPYIISLITGTYVVHRFYGSSLLKSFFVLLLTGLTLFIALIFVILIISLGIAFIK